MRERLLRRRWLLSAAVVTLLILAIIPVRLLTSVSSVSSTATPVPEPPPQAAASAPEPTLVALATLEPTPDATPEVASPFAGIADPPPQPPERPGPVHHTVAEGEVLRSEERRVGEEGR